MTQLEQELDMQVAELQRELASIRRQLDRAVDEAIHLRHALQHIYAKALLVLEPMEIKEHDDKSSY